MAAPTPDQRESIKFFNPAAERGRRIKFAHIKKWRGSHQRCDGHRDGTCVAANAWKVVDKTWAIVPDIAIVNIEDGALGTVKELGKQGAYEEPVWKYKGWLSVEDADGVTPTDEVKRFLIENLVKMRRMDLEHKRAEFETVERECRALGAAAEKANGLTKAKD